ncbi:MAG TPA: serine hydrolase domain-containing protein, partial [Gemmatimonadales bacterium]|nr:serine hydrolase domain-containing protein [Gemmatimonadales bacterium]
RGYGFANIEHRVPVKPETIFQSGSLGKQFTAAAVMLLVEDGKLRLDESIRSYLPDAPKAWQPITIRHLLTHTSGIPDYTTDSFDYWRNYTEAELARLAFGMRTEFPAGTRWNYSNTGYQLLGVIVRRVSGKFYGDVLRERVFGPAGMTTARVISEADIVPNRAAGYRLVNGELKNQEWVAPELNTTADGSLYFTVLDLVAWDRAIGTGAVLSRESWRQVFAPATLASGRHYPYGFGWDVDPVNGRRAQRHGGAWQGFQTYFARYPDDSLSIAVLANLAGSRPGEIVEALAAELVPALAQSDTVPIADEPAVTARLARLLAAARAGRLAPKEFAWVRAGYFPGAPRAFQQLLKDLGEPRTIKLLAREELGDDRLYRYRIGYGEKRIEATLGLAPDDRISEFSLRPL